jgi:hypothetical protein
LGKGNFTFEEREIKAPRKNWRGLRWGLPPEAENRHLLRSQSHFTLQKAKGSSFKNPWAGKRSYLKLKEKRVPVKKNSRIFLYMSFVAYTLPLWRNPLRWKDLI